jgi:hypothetical protein
MEFQFVDSNRRDEIVVKMSGYIKELLKDLNEDREVSTPYGNYLFEIDANSDLLSSEEKENFHSTVARIMYLAKRVRPDILTTCSFLASRVMCPNQQDDRK